MQTMTMSTRNWSKLMLMMMASLLFAVATASAAIYSIPFFSQRNAAWSGQKLGTSTSTIGSAGCAMTCVASVLKYRGADVDPGKLNMWLTKNGGYSNGNLIVWDKAATYNGTRWLTYEGGGTLGSLSQISSQLAQRKLIIAKSKRFAEHWVVIRGVTPDGTQGYYIDPYDLTIQQCRIGDGLVNVGTSTRVYRY